jgi:hypothetical protein
LRIIRIAGIEAQKVVSLYTIECYYYNSHYAIIKYITKPLIF